MSGLEPEEGQAGLTREPPGSTSTSTPKRDHPWVMRTYSGHSTAKASNELYRTNLAKGQTGLSIAFDLPTQIGYDPDAPEAVGEVGKVGVPVAHLGHMAQLLDQIPVDSMNTSMTINATAAWLLGLYIANAEDHGIDPVVLAGTTQNDIVKEYLSRGTYIFPPLPSLRLTVDTIAYTVRHVPRWNPINVCSYHLQEAGATPPQEVAYALATAIGVLDAVRDSGQIPDEEFPSVVGRISFFVNAGVRFVEETCKMRAFTGLWERVCTERYGVTDPKLRRFRYGVQVNSLGLTEAQPENNVPRIVLESLGVTLSKRARARALQLPAWNEALGLPRPWDQQWSLRIQQILAFESDLLEYGDIFDGSVVIEKKTAEVAEASWAELENVLGLGGAFGAIDEFEVAVWWAARPNGSGASRPATSRWSASTASPRRPSRLSRPRAPGRETAATGSGSILRVDPAVESELRADVEAWRANAHCHRGRGMPSTSSSGRPRAPTTSCPPPSPWPTPAAPPASGPAPSGRYSGSTGPRPASAAAWDIGRSSTGRCVNAPGPWPPGPAVRPSCWWPNRGSTATPTGPSRSPWPPVMPASKSSTRASACRRRRSRRRPGTRTSTSWASPSSREATSSWCPRWSTG